MYEVANDIPKWEDINKETLAHFMKDGYRKVTDFLFSTHNDGDPGWGTYSRRKLFLSACQYLDASPYEANHIASLGLNSLFQSEYVYLTGQILDKIIVDPSIANNQKAKITDNIYSKSECGVESFEGTFNYTAGLGGERSQVDMWTQLLEVHKWADEYSATWQVAMRELTWAVRGCNVYVRYKVDANGRITLNNELTDVLDLRPDWANRSSAYNAACVVLGAIYHDALGGSDEIKVRACWTTVIEPHEK